MISDTIQSQIQDAMKAHDDLRVSTLKLLSSALSYEKIAKMHDLSEEEEIAVVQKEVKKRKDAVELYRKGDAEEKAVKEEAEIQILKEFLPEEMTDNELTGLVEAAIAETGAKEMRDMGRVIVLVKEKTQGRADGARISQLVKNKLTS
jgi:uncharacterized protein